MKLTHRTEWWAFPTFMTAMMSIVISTFLLCVFAVVSTKHLIDWISS